ncbi:MAG: hypothetical protein EVB12_00445 [Winogradskyella sp.]|nr:MAG: hypothetical protein EVB12_00445 [Winogradskyella sp.]
MKIQNYFLIIFLMLGISSCKKEIKDVKQSDVSDTISNDLQLDHFNIWVENPTKAKEKLKAIGFTAVPDSLSMIHEGQGTSGRYFNFLNTYLEFIFVHDQNELEENIKKNKNLDFIERSNFQKNGASPFTIALKVKDYAVEKIPFEKIRYHQDWMAPKASIYAAKNSKLNLNEPSVFVVYPEIETKNFKTFDDLKDVIPDEVSYYRDTYNHVNGTKKVTDIIITSNNLDLNSKTIEALNGIKNLKVKNGKAHLMEIYFDNSIQGKSFDLRPELPLIIYL